MRMKREIRFYTIMDYEKEQLYLQKRHEEGWKFVKVTGIGIYHFEKCRPEEVIYQLDYNQEGREQKEEYVQMFQDCGWEYIMDYVGYSYFRKPVREMKEDEGIFCDDNSRLEMMQRIFKGRMLPLLAIFCACLIPQFFVQLSLEESMNDKVAGMLGVMILIYLAIFIHYAIKYIEYKKKLGSSIIK